MAVGLILSFSGQGKAEYDAVSNRLGIDMNTGSGAWPPGLLSHTAGTNDAGDLYVVEVWESKDAQSRFMQERLGRAIAEGGMSATPQMTWIDVFSYHQPGNRSSA